MIHTSVPQYELLGVILLNLFTWWNVHLDQLWQEAYSFNKHIKSRRNLKSFGLSSLSSSLPKGLTQSLLRRSADHGGSRGSRTSANEGVIPEAHEERTP